METLIPFIKSGDSRGSWSNGKWGYFTIIHCTESYNDTSLRFVEVEAGNGYKLKHDDECPIIAKGFIVFLIDKLDDSTISSEVDYYDTYYVRLRDEYKTVEGKKAGASKKNLNDEFYKKHLVEEKERIEQSQQLFDFLTEKDREDIRNYIRCYFEYIEQFDQSQYADSENCRLDPLKLMVLTRKLKSKAKTRQKTFDFLNEVFNHEIGRDARLMFPHLNEGKIRTFNTSNKNIILDELEGQLRNILVQFDNGVQLWINKWFEEKREEQKEIKNVQIVVQKPLKSVDNNMEKILNTGEISKAQYKEASVELLKAIRELYKPIKERNNISGADTSFFSLFNYLMNPYQIFGRGENLPVAKKKRKLLDCETNRTEIRFQLDFLHSQAFYLKNNKGGSEVEIFVEFVKKSFGFFREATWLYFGSFGFYDNNFYKEQLEEWMRNFEIDFNLERYKLKNGGVIIETSNIFQQGTENKDVKQSQKSILKKENISITPSINIELIEPLFEILKGFFDVEQQNELHSILKTFGNATHKLLFKGYANRLCHTFRELIEKDIITGMTKKELIDWLVLNFQSTHNREIKDLNRGTTEKSISSNEYNCKKPIIRVKANEILKME